MKVSFKLIESDKEITNKIVKQLLPDARKFMSSTMSKIQNTLPLIIEQAIVNSPEYTSIISGKLRLELGIPDGQSKIAGLIFNWINNIQYNYSVPSIVNNKIKSRISIRGIRSDFRDVLGTEYALVIDQLRGYSLPWLEWLLLDGTKTIVPSHDVFLGPNPRSRTGLAVMRYSSSGWGISEFSGTQADNWITRAIDMAEPDIRNILEKAFV